jgi:DNA-binding IclR family transcriptional regulator
LPREHLRLEDVSDRYLLEVLATVQTDVEEGASSEDIAAEIGLDVQYPKRCVSSRFVWLRRYGVVDRDAETGKWRFTEDGLKLFRSGLRARERERFASMDEASLAAVTTEVANRLGGMRGSTYHVTRREFQRGQYAWVPPAKPATRKSKGGKR